MIYNNTFISLQTADSGGAIDVARAAAFVGYNTIDKVAITDLGGGIYCYVPNFGP